MNSALFFTLLVCLSCGLWTGADGARCGVTKARCRCPSGWTQYRNRCFRFINSATDWATAERRCIAAGGNLASFHSYSELNALRIVVYRAVRSFRNTWVGGNDAVKDGVWMWTDGSRFNYIRWYRGEPNNTGGRESCLELNFRGTSYLNDERCSSRRPFICARER